MSLRRRIILVTAMVGFMLCCLPVAAQEAPQTVAPDRFSDQPLRADDAAEPDARSTSTGTGPSILRIAGSLLLVAGLVVGLGIAYRRMFVASGKQGGGGVTLVSRQMLTPKHQVFVIKAGHRLLVVGDSGHGMNLLSEITDPVEVTSVLGEAGNNTLRGEAFAASLTAADESFGEETTYEEDTDHLGDPAQGLGEAREEVQSLIERVRRLAGQGTGIASSESANRTA